jgi:hypothetical protein
MRIAAGAPEPGGVARTVEKGMADNAAANDRVMIGWFMGMIISSAIKRDNPQNIVWGRPHYSLGGTFFVVR